MVCPANETLISWHLSADIAAELSIVGATLSDFCEASANSAAAYLVYAFEIYAFEVGRTAVLNCRRLKQYLNNRGKVEGAIAISPQLIR